MQVFFGFGTFKKKIRNYSINSKNSKFRFVGTVFGYFSQYNFKLFCRRPTVMANIFTQPHPTVHFHYHQQKRFLQPWYMRTYINICTIVYKLLWNKYISWKCVTIPTISETNFAIGNYCYAERLLLLRLPRKRR